MKRLTLIGILSFSMLCLEAQVDSTSSVDTSQLSIDYPSIAEIKNLRLPDLGLPPGSIFCRMEKYLTEKTGVWIKVRLPEAPKP